MPIATTFDAIRSSIVEAIRGIAPTYAPDSAKRWNYVHDPESVPSLDARNYFVDLEIPVDDGDIYGGCLQHTAELRLITSYGGLRPSEEQVMPARDNQDLWAALHAAEIDGASKFIKGGFDREGEPGRLWGAHVFTVTLFLPLP